MSLVFRIKAVLMKNKSDEEAKVWLESRNLKSQYGNMKKRRMDDEGYQVYKQHSNTGKVDPEQVVKVIVEEDIVMIGEYRYPKYMVERKKRGPGNGPGGRKPKVIPESRAASPHQDSDSESEIREV